MYSALNPGELAGVSYSWLVRVLAPISIAIFIVVWPVPSAAQAPITPVPGEWTETLVITLPRDWRVVSKTLVGKVRTTRLLLDSYDLDHWSGAWTMISSGGKPDGGLSAFLNSKFAENEHGCALGPDRGHPQFDTERGYPVVSGAYSCVVLNGDTLGRVVLYKIYEVRYGFMLIQREWHMSFPPFVHRSYNDFDRADEATDVLAQTRVCNTIEGKVTCAPVSR